MGLNSANAPEVQTDKPKNKVVPCAVDDCGQPLIVNTFYAPARARCSRHRDSPINLHENTLVAPESKETPSLVIPKPKLPVPPEPNHSLETLCCPFGHGLMTILRVDNMGFVTFKCGECKTAVEVKPAWAPLLMREIPEPLKEVVMEYNQRMFDRGAAAAASGEYVKPSGF